MRVYANRPGRFVLQLVADVLALSVLVGALIAGWAVHQTVMAFSGPARSVERASTNLARNLTDAGNELGRAPVVGDVAQHPFDAGANAAESIARSSREQQRAIQRLATRSAVTTAAPPMLVTLALWLPSRARWARQATVAHRAANTDHGRDLLALRALANASLRSIRSRCDEDDPVEAWRRGHPRAVEQLAAVELARLGLRDPHLLTGAR